MAGFFGLNNYSKPGPGISKDIGEKKSPILFLEIYFRKFWKLIQANFLFILACIPFFIPLLVFILMRLNSLPFFLIGLIPLAGIGPALSGLTYILRNFAREQHAFIWMDFWDTYKSNWKQSTLVMLINIIISYMLYVSLTFYQANLSNNSFYIAPLLFVFLHL